MACCEHQSLTVDSIRIRNEENPDELVLFTDEIKHCSEWIAASGPESFVDLRKYQ